MKIMQAKKPKFSGLFTAPISQKITPQQWFLASTLIVNAGNYLYNLILGRLLGPAEFADAALLITILLVLSFAGMTFQITTAKFTVDFDNDDHRRFKQLVYRYALVSGAVLGGLLIYFAKELQLVLNTSTPKLFTVLGIGIPLYFAMSVNRGFYQGSQRLLQLSFTYQFEMWSRLLITLILLYIMPWSPAYLVAIGICISFAFGLFPLKIDWKLPKLKRAHALVNHKKILLFLATTGFYEFTQIAINNSDILLVKAYFTATDAGLYAAISLIGRVVYFITWMFVMLLIPEVINLAKKGDPTRPIFFKYLSYIGVLSLSITISCSLFPETIINMLFGKAYISAAPLLWKYALSTTLFSLANVFTYYFLSLERFLPVAISAVFGAVQVGTIIYLHETLSAVITIQIFAMGALLLCLALYYFRHSYRIKRETPAY
ncbi:MAG: sugar isomerase [Leeuwenhoekiella sp.]